MESMSRSGRAKKSNFHAGCAHRRTQGRKSKSKK